MFVMKFNFKTILTLLLILNSFLLSANNPPPPAVPPPGSPINSGVFILLIISVAYGVYKIYQFNKKNASN